MKRRWPLPLVLCIVLCFTVFSVPALAEEVISGDIVEDTPASGKETSPLPPTDLIGSAAGVRITVDTINAKAGEIVTVPVRISGNTGIAGLSFEVTLGGGLTLSSIEKGSVLSGSISSNGNIINWFDMSGNVVSDNGVLLNLQLKVSDSAEGTIPVSVNVTGGKASNLSDLNSTAIPAEFAAGSVSVTASSSLTDLALNLSQKEYTEEYTYDDVQEDLVSAPDEHPAVVVPAPVPGKEASAEPTKEAEIAPLHVQGDVNGDGRINCADLLRLMKHIESGAGSAVSGDVNGDSVINDADILCLTEYIKARGSY